MKKLTKAGIKAMLKKIDAMKSITVQEATNMYFSDDANPKETTLFDVKQYCYKKGCKVISK